jgi:hypothetical protein
MSDSDFRDRIAFHSLVIEKGGVFDIRFGTNSEAILMANSYLELGCSVQFHEDGLTLKVRAGERVLLPIVPGAAKIEA